MFDRMIKRLSHGCFHIGPISRLRSSVHNYPRLRIGQLSTLGLDIRADMEKAVYSEYYLLLSNNYQSCSSRNHESGVDGRCVAECNPTGFYQCPGEHGPCLVITQKCDGVNDCPDSSDEMNCDSGM